MNATQPSRSAQARRVSPNYEQAQHLCISTSPSAHRAFVFMVLQNPFSATRLFSHLYKTPGGVGSPPSPATPLLAVPRQMRGKFFRCHTFKECPPKSFRCHTYKIALPQ